MMEALVFGEISEKIEVVSHDNVALFEQYEPLAAMNDEIGGEAAADYEDCEVDNLYFMPVW